MKTTSRNVVRRGVTPRSAASPKTTSRAAKKAALATPWKAAAKTRAVSEAAPVKSKQVGPVNELEPMSAIVVAKPDGYGPTLKIHNDIAAKLPKNTKLLLLERLEATEAFDGPAPAGALTMRTTIDSQWTRDFAPVFVRTPSGTLEIAEFKYKGELSDGVAPAMAQKLGLKVRSSPLVLEGGNLLVDQGTLFVTTRVQRANKTMTPAQITAELKRVLSVKKVEWLKPLPDESTGHVDMFAKLIAPKTMLVSDTAHAGQKAVMDEAANRFEALGYKVVRAENAAIPPNDPDVTQWGPVRSYANSLVVNGTAYVPQYLSPLDKTLGHGKRIAALDKRALEVYRTAGLKIVPIAANDIIAVQGSVHCMTNTFPAEIDLSKLLN